MIYPCNFIRFFIRICLTMTFLVSSFATYAVRPYEGLLLPEKASLLKKSEGYLLVDLMISGVGPSFEFVKIVSKKNQRYVSDQGLRFTKEKWSISLKDKPAGLYVLKLPHGIYQITHVKAPFFNLPYRMSTYNNSRWRFSIVKGEVSYIGQLFIDHERGDDYVNIKMNNRFATDFQRIVDAASFLSGALLRHGMGMRDDFSQDLLDDIAVMKDEGAGCLSSDIC